MVAGGNKQRGTINKEDATSPTAALESILLTATIDAKDGRDVAIINIPNAFVQTRIEDDNDIVIMRLRGKLLAQPGTNKAATSFLTSALENGLPDAGGHPYQCHMTSLPA